MVGWWDGARLGFTYAVHQHAEVVRLQAASGILGHDVGCSKIHLEIWVIQHYKFGRHTY